MGRDESVDGKLDDSVVIENEGKVLAIVPVELIRDDIFLNVVTPFMQSALRYGIEGYDPEYYIDLCVSGKAHLWAGIRGSVISGIMVTMKVEYPAFSVLRVLMCAGATGSLEKFGEMAWNGLCRWAKALGATNIEAWGRPGWEPALCKYARPEKKIQVLSYKVP